MAKFFKSSLLSDIEVEYVLAERCNHQLERPAKRHKNEIISRFPAHKFCLGSTSSVLRYEIEAGVTVVKVELDDALLMPVADAMFASMYGVKDATDGLSQSDRLHLALLCNKYAVSELLNSTVKQLSSEDLGPEILTQLWQLDGCWQQPFWPLLQQAIPHKLSSSDNDKLQAVVDLLLYVCDSDLEAVWTDHSNFRRHLILNLPEEVLIAFLQSSELRVLSEDTITLTIISSECYKAAAHMTGVRATPERLRRNLHRVLEVVRVPHLTLAALLFIMPQLQWVKPEELNMAAFYKQSQQEVRWGLRHPSWGLEQRNMSTKSSHRFVFTISVSSLLSCCSELLRRAEGSDARMERHVQAVQSNDSAFNGRKWVLYWRLKKAAGDTGVSLSCVVKPVFPGITTQLPWHGKKLTITGIGRHATTSKHTVPIGVATNHFSSARVVWFSSLDSCAELEAAVKPWAKEGDLRVKVTVAI